MTHTRRTLKLNPKTWDLTLDASGAIALTDGAGATAQNVANEARLFTGDAYFNQDKGTPFFVLSLGRRENAAILRSYLRRAAMNVPDVKEVRSVEITEFDKEKRTIKGTIQFTTNGDAHDGTIRTLF